LAALVAALWCVPGVPGAPDPLQEKSTGAKAMTAEHRKASTTTNGSSLVLRMNPPFG
jgi:hypothetical protein